MAKRDERRAYDNAELTRLELGPKDSVTFRAASRLLDAVDARTTQDGLGSRSDLLRALLRAYLAASPQVLEAFLSGRTPDSEG